MERQDRDLHDDWYSGHGLITEVEMSLFPVCRVYYSNEFSNGSSMYNKIYRKRWIYPCYVRRKVSKESNSENEFSREFQAMEQVQEEIDANSKSLDDKKSLGVKRQKKNLFQNYGTLNIISEVIKFLCKTV